LKCPATLRPLRPLRLRGQVLGSHAEPREILPFAWAGIGPGHAGDCYGFLEDLEQRGGSRFRCAALWSRGLGGGGDSPGPRARRQHSLVRDRRRRADKDGQRHWVGVRVQRGGRIEGDHVEVQRIWQSRGPQRSPSRNDARAWISGPRGAPAPDEAARAGWRASAKARISPASSPSPLSASCSMSSTGAPGLRRRSSRSLSAQRSPPRPWQCAVRRAPSRCIGRRHGARRPRLRLRKERKLGGPRRARQAQPPLSRPSSKAA
jgi:hypothetical protein